MNRASAVEIVTRRGWLARQSKGLREALIQAATLRRYEAGEHVYSLGDEPNGLFGLVEGELDLLIAPLTLPPSFVHVAQPGWWVGEAALITNTPRRVTLTARSVSWLFVIDRSKIERLAAANPKLWRNLAEIAVSHLDHALMLVAALSQHDPKTRVLAILHIMIAIAGEKEDVTIPLTHEALGEMARLRRNAARKVLIDLEHEGLIEMRYGRLFVPRPTRLEEVLEKLGNRDRSSR